MPLAVLDYGRGQGLTMESVAGARKKRILVVDDHALVRAGFRQLIDGSEDLVVGGEAGTAASALELAMAQDFDVVMLDISLPDASVVETVTMLRRRRPNLPILIVSMHAEEQYAVNLLRAGASGFFPKAGEAKDLWMRFAPSFPDANTSARRLPRRWRSRPPAMRRSPRTGSFPTASSRSSCNLLAARP